METTINEPFLTNPRKKGRRRGKGLPSALLKRLHKQGVPRKRVMKEAWKQFRRGIKNPGELLIVNKTGGEKRMKRRRRGMRSLLRRGTVNPIGLGSFAMNPRRRYYRRYRRNPALGGLLPRSTMSTVVSTLKDSVIATGGFIGVKLIPNYVFPVNWRVGTLGIASKGITAIALSLISSRVLGKKIGDMMLLGGMVAITTELAGQLLLSAGGTVSDAMQLGVYMPELSAYISPDNK